MSARALTENPFFVLGLAPECERAEVERQAQKLLAMLGVGVASAAAYQTPLGTFPRTPDLVRAAVAELRDPDRRLVHELWARASTEDTSSPAAPAWPEARKRVVGGRW